MGRRLARLAIFAIALWCAPAAFGAGVSATTFSAAGSATRPDLGPCALSVAGVTTVSGTAGRGSFAAADLAQTPGQTTCNGGPASLRFGVVSAAFAPGTTTLTVTVTASDDPSGAPVGTVGSIVASAGVGGDSIFFAIGTHSGGYSGAAGHTGGFIETWADVAIDTHAAAARVTSADGVGTAVDIGGGFGPCTVAAAGTRTTLADGSVVTRGGGSYQARAGTPPPPENLVTATCNGGASRFGFELADLTVGNGGAQLGLRVGETSDATVPVGLPGTVGLYDTGPPAQKVNVAFGNKSGGFGPGRFLFHGFIDERGVANTTTTSYGSAATPAPAAGGIGATTFSAAGTATRGDAGPCALSVAGSQTVLSAGGRGTLTASGRPPAATVSSSCAGGPATLRFSVTGASRTGDTVTLSVEVTASDDASGGTIVGSLGTIVATSTAGGDTIDFAIGAHAGSFTGTAGHAAAATATWADVRVASHATAVDVVNFDGSGTSVDGPGNFGPCTMAVAGTATTLANGTTIVDGGGSQQALSGTLPVPAADSSTCSGGPAAYGVDVREATVGVAANAALGLVVTETVTGPATGIPGGITLYETGPPAQKLNVLVGNHIGGFGPGALTATAFSERRAAANVFSRPVSSPGGGGPGDVVSTPGRVLGHGELPEIVAGTGGIPVVTFSLAATATRPDLGPCALSLAGWSTAAGTTGLGSFAAADEPRAPSQTTCNGPPASLRFAVRSVVVTGTSYTATVEVIESDSPGSAPVGTIGTVVATQGTGGVSILFGIGAHSGGFSMGPGHTGGFIDTWADVRLATYADGLTVVATDGVGTSVDVIGAPRPCTVAAAATRVRRANGALVTTGGGSLQSDGSCNGGTARFGFSATALVTDATTTATVAGTVTESTVGTAPVGSSGTVSLQEDVAGANKTDVVFGPHSGGFGPGRNLFNGYLDERPVDNVSSVDLRTLPGAAPLQGDARKSPRVDLDNVRVRGASDAELKGRVKFEDRALGISFKTSEVTSLVVTGSVAVVRGFAVLQGPGTGSTPVSFRVEVDDTGKKVDTLSIHLSNGYERNGVLTKGDFQVRPS